MVIEEKSVCSYSMIYVTYSQMVEWDDVRGEERDREGMMWQNVKKKKRKIEKHDIMSL